MLETSLIHDLRTISAQQQKILCGLELIKEEKKPPVLVILRCLAKKKKKKRDSKYYLHCSALFIEALKLFPDFQQNISVIMATSPNRGIGGKTEESWKHGWCESMALREYLWRCAGREGLILCHMSFFSLCCSPCSYRLKDLTMKHSFKGNMLWNIFCTWSSLSFRF